MIRIRDEQPGSCFRELRKNFCLFKIHFMMWIQDSGSGIWDEKKIGSGMENFWIRDKHTRSATLVVTNEFLLKFFFSSRGRGFSFKQFMKTKPGKFGFLYRSLNDSKWPYTYRSHIVAGKPASNPTEHYVQGVEEVVMRTIKLYAKEKEVKGRNITFDRLDSSFSQYFRTSLIWNISIWSLGCGSAL